MPNELPHFWNILAFEGLTLQMKRHLNVFVYVILFISPKKQLLDKHKTCYELYIKGNLLLKDFSE